MTEPDVSSRMMEATPALARPERAEIDGLLRAVAHGDDASFSRLYDLVAPRVFGLARRVLRDPVPWTLGLVSSWLFDTAASRSGSRSRAAALRST